MSKLVVQRTFLHLLSILALRKQIVKRWFINGFDYQINYYYLIVYSKNKYFLLINNLGVLSRGMLPKIYSVFEVKPQRIKLHNMD